MFKLGRKIGKKEGGRADRGGDRVLMQKWEVGRRVRGWEWLREGSGRPLSA